MREHDARGDGGGFAPLEAFCRRVAGVSHLYWRNSPPVMSGHEGRRAQTAAPRRLAPRSTPKPPPPRHNGGFCTIRSILSACRRRVAPLMLQFPPFAGSEIAVRGGEVAVRGGEAPTSPATAATNADNGASCPGWRGRGSLHCGHNDAWPRVELAREPAIASTSLLFRT